MTNVTSFAMDVERPRAAKHPTSREYRTVGGCGSGRVCAGCGAVIHKDKMEIRVEYGPQSGMDSLVMHLKCFSTWLEAVGGGELQYYQTSLR